MAGKLNLEVAVPERQLVNEEVDEVQAPAATGYLGVLPGHAPLLSELQVGVLSFRVGDKIRAMALDGGVMEVLPAQVRVLADEAQWGEEVDIDKESRTRDEVQERLRERTESVDFDRERLVLARAQARLEAHARARAS
ncbi:MAG: ATP synthase F1 subunit epsilon [Bryobacterales bacterium]|nr:ATP synthase F1 subunit epsilon [Bryobacterales bacterium]MDE0293227.1 ATP synthase F1 subunit epsilon [Bryobacterales bacterium]